MKPLIIFQFEPHGDPEDMHKFSDYIRDEANAGGFFKDYDVIVLQGDVKAQVYYPHKPIRYYFNKIKAWVFLKIWKKKRFSNTSVIL